MTVSRRFASIWAPTSTSRRLPASSWASWGKVRRASSSSRPHHRPRPIPTSPRKTGSGGKPSSAELRQKRYNCGAATSYRRPDFVMPPADQARDVGADRTGPFTKGLEGRVLRFVRQRRVLLPGEHVLAAVSGGPDPL